MAPIKLIETALPKSGSGRKAAELSQELVDALATAFGENAVVEVDGEKRPRALSPESTYDTAGKAGAAGRRYADAIAEKMTTDKENPVVVKVNVHGASRNDKKEWVGPFQWRVYLPLKSE